MRKLKCIVFGANGYVGSHLSDFMTRNGYEVQNCDIQKESELENYFCVDITKKNDFEQLDLNVNYIFFFSGLTGTSVGFEKYQDFISINEIGLLNLLNEIRIKSHKPHIIFPSSRLVYKGIDYPLREENEKEAKTVYAMNKLACENYLKMYHNTFGIPYTIFRLCVPYGNTLKKNYSFGTIGFFLKKAMNREPVTIYGDGNIKRTFTHITDICIQITECIKSPQSLNNVFNIGGEVFSLKDVALTIANRYGVDVISVDWPEQDLKIESGHTYFDDKKIKSIIGNYTYTKFDSFNWI